MPHDLNETQRHLIALALRSSAERWREWSVSIANSTVAAAFGQQADDANQLADVLESADAGAVTPGA